VTVTQADAQAWLERQADHYCAEGGTFTSDLPLGVTGLGVRLELSGDFSLRASLCEKFKPGPLTFYAVWLGIELTTTRQWSPRSAR
jgi:hypothetical protein